MDGEPRPDLVEAIEVDISASPLNNTLPIRRLDLAIGESSDITTAYVTLPEERSPSTITGWSSTIPGSSNVRAPQWADKHDREEEPVKKPPAMSPSDLPVAEVLDRATG